MNRLQFAELIGSERHAEHRAVVVDSADEENWTRQFLRAAAGEGPVFLANPDWGQAERDQFNTLVEAHPEDWNPEEGWLMVATGGSSGGVKLARHDQNSLAAAAAGCAAHFGLGCINTLGTLPRHHIGGMMAWLRSGLTGGVHLAGSWRRLAEGGLPQLPDEPMMVSLVPTQLARLRQIPEAVEWLRRFEIILVGGAALDEDMASWARGVGLPLAPSYGATETGAVAAASLPSEFLAGAAGVGRALPHLSVEVDPQGQLTWRGKSMFRGYWPENFRNTNNGWVSGDLGEIAADGRLNILGRVDALINSGGEKVNPAEVEAVLGPLLGSRHFLVVGVPDAKWGNRVVLAHADEIDVDLDQMWKRISGKLARFKWPKNAVSVEPWPINAMGKVDRKQIHQTIMRSI